MLFRSYFFAFRNTRFRSVAVLVAAFLATIPTPGLGAGPAEPWRIDSAAALPDWLSISGSHRTRYESLEGQFRATLNGDDQAVVLRTIVLTELRFDAFRIGVEGIDSRAYLNDGGSTLSTTIINPVELLQGYIAWDASGLFRSGDRSVLRAGRLTLDVGSRRLVARSLYRNTINTFTGFEWNWHGPDGGHFQAFYTLPVNRKPNLRSTLLDNDVEFDEEDSEVRFWGVYYAFANLPSNLRGEVFFLGLDEDDATGRPSRNREYYMPGFRFYRPPATGRVDFLVESVLQLGESRSSTMAANTTDLDHFAHFQHVEAGYSVDAPWSPRLILQYDYASGDDDPTDNDNERFDTLFGARRFDFGPTGIYGPFLRNNLSTPGLRLQLKPARDVKVFVAYRGYWLASDQDAWTTSGVRDPAGRSGSFIGHQVEARFRWEVVPGNYRFETGVAHLFAGEFMNDAPNANGEGDATYVYTQALFKF